MQTISQIFGRPPRRIDLYSGAFKTEEWKKWIIHCSLPLLMGRIPGEYFKGWAQYVKCCVIAEQFEVGRSLIGELQRHSVLLFAHLEDQCFEHREDCAHFMTYAHHSLLRLAESLHSSGPLRNFNQLAMERYIGEMSKMIRNAERGVENISNSLLTVERLKLVGLDMPSITGKEKLIKQERQISTRIRLQLDPEARPERKGHAFLGPSQEGLLTLQESQLLRECCSKQELEAAGPPDPLYRLTQDEMKITEWGRLETLEPGYHFKDAVIAASRSLGDQRSKRSRHHISAGFRESNGEWARYYGRVEKFFHHHYRAVDSMLAVARWASKRGIPGSGAFCYNKGVDRVFGGPGSEKSIESVEVIKGAVGALERPHRDESGKQRSRTFILDPDPSRMLEIHGFNRSALEKP